KLSAEATHHENSNGLGLTLVKMLVDMHKGKLWAESEGTGKGTTFYVQLPIK
ncbi:MAG: ATP-binding protein, partial [Pedobacter sp.]